MPVEQIVFWLFSAVMVASSLRVITARNPVHSALFLVLTFFTAAALWLLLEAEFLAIILVLVYVGMAEHDLIIPAAIWVLGAIANWAGARSPRVNVLCYYQLLIPEAGSSISSC